jgi:DNA-binding winged helix-turn-helix (wHTH) protein/tetratricopeptide (TPR) repeat protein
MLTRFASFEVDLDGRRLLKHGKPVPLREQSFQVLAALMERPGEIVTREELRKRLWPRDTTVDFEVALNSAVSRLRDALGDAAYAPSVIETIPKRGYRFVPPISKRPGVAVMPFGDEYFGAGLADEVIRVLSRIDGLRVFKGQREPGVEAMLEGSVSRLGDRIRVNVTLVRVKDGFSLWAQRFDGTLADVFAIQDQVCAAVAEALHVRFAARVHDRPRNVNAYVEYLKGHHILKRRRPDDVRRAFEYVQEAIRLDPEFAEPYYGAAMYYIVSAVFGALDPQAALRNAEELVSKGLALNEHSVNLQSTLGMLRMHQWRWAESQQAHERALSLEPGNAFPHMMYAVLCSILGRHDEAVSHAARSVELDPLDVMTNFRVVQANYYARRYDEAVRTGRIAVELTPDSPYTFFYLALALAAVGARDEAWDAALAGKKLNDGLPLGEGYFGYVAGALGHHAEAQDVIEALGARPALPIAWTYLGLGEHTAALDYLETAVADHEPYAALVNVFPGYDAIRDQARFRDISLRIWSSDSTSRSASD